MHLVHPLLEETGIQLGFGDPTTADVHAVRRCTLEILEQSDFHHVHSRCSVNLILDACFSRFVRDILSQRLCSFRHFPQEDECFESFKFVDQEWVKLSV